MGQKEQMIISFDEVVKHIEDALRTSKALFKDAPTLHDVLYHLKARDLLNSNPKDDQTLIADKDWKKGVVRYCGYHQEYLAGNSPSDPQGVS